MLGRAAVVIFPLLLGLVVFAGGWDVWLAGGADGNGAVCVRAEGAGARCAEAYLYGWTKLPVDQVTHPMFLLGNVYATECGFSFRWRC